MSALTFHETSFEVIERDGERWLRGLQIASALGYRNPAADARNLYERNAAEFTDAMTAVVKLHTAGGLQDVRIFSPRGTHLLGMFARTPRAAEFRHWVLDVLEGKAAPRGRRGAELDLRALNAAQRTLAKLLKATDATERAVLYAQFELCQARLGLAVPPLASIGREAPPEPPQPPEVDAFWEAFRWLEAQGEALNHSRRPGVLAVSLPQVQQVAAARRVHLPAPHQLRALRHSKVPAYVDQRVVNSAHLGKTVWCWVFTTGEAPPAAGEQLPLLLGAGQEGGAA